MPSIPLPHAPESAPRLRGDLGVWLIILAELLTFGIFFVSYAFARSRDVAGFNAAQATLDLHSGAFNTVLLHRRGFGLFVDAAPHRLALVAGCDGLRRRLWRGEAG